MPDQPGPVAQVLAPAPTKPPGEIGRRDGLRSVLCGLSVSSILAVIGGVLYAVVGSVLAQASVQLPTIASTLHSPLGVFACMAAASTATKLLNAYFHGAPKATEAEPGPEIAPFPGGPRAA